MPARYDRLLLFGGARIDLVYGYCVIEHDLYIRSLRGDRYFLCQKCFAILSRITIIIHNRLFFSFSIIINRILERDIWDIIPSMVCIYDCYVINIDLLAEITIVILLANKEINHKVNYIFQKKKKERENKFPRLVLISILSTIQIRTYLRGGRREKNIETFSPSIIRTYARTHTKLIVIAAINRKGAISRGPFTF